jgi:phosphatidate cytidylyltransferase
VQRLIVAVPALAVLVVVVAQGGALFAVVLAALGLICLHELFQMFDNAKPARLAGFAALIGILAAAEYGTQFNVLLAFALAVPLTFVVAAGPNVRGGAASIAVTLMGVYWIGLGLAHAILLRDLPHGDGVVVAVLVGTFVGDSGAYLGGRAFGSRPLAPRISPKKTVEGLAIGIVTGTIAVWFAGIYQPWISGTQSLLLGLVVTLAAPAGDLFESFLKRDAGRKDTGRLFGAHGGALDRVDAALFTAVAGYYIWHAML